MEIRTRMCMSLDGYVTTPEGWPVQLADPSFDPASYGFVEFQERCQAVLMGRTTFEPALGAERWPWPDLDGRAPRPNMKALVVTPGNMFRAGWSRSGTSLWRLVDAAAGATRAMLGKHGPAG